MRGSAWGISAVSWRVPFGHRPSIPKIHGLLALVSDMYNFMFYSTSPYYSRQQLIYYPPPHLSYPLDCQKRYFDGWPEYKLLINGHLDDEWRSTVRDKCTDDDDPVMPNLPRVPGGEPTTACPRLSSNADGNANDEEEEWKLTKLFTMAELNNSKPLMCSNEDCGLVACSRWVSTESGKTWNSCLDCQAA
jgi:hypothetical protein